MTDVTEAADADDSPLYSIYRRNLPIKVTEPGGINVYEAWSTERIRLHLDGLLPAERLAAAAALSEDRRAAVRKLGDRVAKQVLKEQAEQERLIGMRQAELALSGGIGLLCGIDEAGRGPLAGPVVAAAVILPENVLFSGLNDSKKVSETVRERLYDEITEAALAWGVGVVSAERIDEINILEATREAMCQAVEAMGLRPDYILIDAVEIKGLAIPHRGIVKGDEICLSIAAASIIAKVTRDRIMTALGKEYPAYGFEIHKGYGTARHYEALSAEGMTAEHRRSFLKNVSFD